MYKKFIALALAAVVLAGCDTYNQSLGLGAGLGAIGATLVGGDPLLGAGAGTLAVIACDEGLICPK